MRPISLSSGRRPVGVCAARPAIYGGAFSPITAPRPKYRLMHITPALIARIDRFSVDFHAARMGAAASLPGNPFGISLRAFGEGVAVKVRHPLLAGKNRIAGFRAGDLGLLSDLCRFYQGDGLRFTLTVTPGQINTVLFQHLTEAGLWSQGSSAVPALVPSALPPPAAPAGVVVRRSGPDEKDLYLDLFQQAFTGQEEAAPEYRAFQWAEDALPGGVRYLAEMDGKLAAMASFPLVDGVGYCGAAGVLPAYRGRGVQSALIRRRIADAAELGCDLVLGGGSPGTTTFRNFERAGLSLVPQGMVWKELRAMQK